MPADLNLRSDDVASAMGPGRSTHEPGRSWAWWWVPSSLVTVLPVVSRYSRTSFFYDEWTLINRVAGSGHGWSDALRSFNGHFWPLPYAVYAAQVWVFGLRTHALVFAVFSASLVAMHLALATVLRLLRVPLLPAFIAAGLVTYLGRGAQNMVFEIQLSWNFAYALGLAAAATVLRAERGRPFMKATWVAAALLLVAAGWDSVIASLLAVFTVCIGLLEWRRPAALLPAVPPVAIMLAAAAGTQVPGAQPSSLNEGATFAIRLLLAGLGTLAGRGELVGAAILGATAALLASATAARRLSRPALTALAAGLVTTGAAVASTTATRARLVGTDLNDYNRYVQLVAVCLLLALAPPLAALIHSTDRRVDHQRTAAIAVALLVAVGLNVEPLLAYRRTFEGWNRQTAALIGQSVGVLREGCPPGSGPAPDATPLGSLDPQVTVALLQVLAAEGVAPAARPATPRIVAAICRV